ncbi:Glucosamine-phosphate N-acetyltransferase-like protein [Boothiomyces sp. JEL0866]|nr:Glucosamine-phosphate N-acetyltransferase-like protein [Boothiomyces sp. JEL0866]
MSEQLFSPKLISPAVTKSLKPGFVVRPLAPTDYDKDRYNYLKKHNHEYFTIVIEDTVKQVIVGAGTIFVERKFVHHNGLVGHIEDIVTHSEYRGKNLGWLVIETLKYIGDQTVILDCSDKNVPFYEKCGFKQKEFEMAYYIPANDVPNAKAKL